jgi:hypothetical protein
MSEMNEFEQQVARALRPVDAPEGFAARVMARAVATNAVVMRPRLHAQMWVGGAVAAMLAVGAFVGEAVHVRRQREEAALATQQFDAAVRVTDQAIERTRMHLEKAGLKLGD